MACGDDARVCNCEPVLVGTITMACGDDARVCNREPVLV